MTTHSVRCTKGLLHLMAGSRGGLFLPAPVVRLPKSHEYAIWPQSTDCHPCNSNRD